MDEREIRDLMAEYGPSGPGEVWSDREVLLLCRDVEREVRHRAMALVQEAANNIDHLNK